MNTCEEYIPALSAFIDGELNEEERNDVLAHLDGCEACRGYLAQLTAMKESLSAELTPPEGFAAGVMERLHGEKPAEKKRPRRSRWLGLAACAAVVVMAGALTLPQMGKGAASMANSKSAQDAVSEESAPAEEEYLDETATIHYNSLKSNQEPFASEPESGAPEADLAGGMQPEGFALTSAPQEPYLTFCAAAPEAETYLVEQGAEIYEQTDEICSYLVPAETVRVLAEQGLLEETGEELAVLDTAEGDIVVVVRKAAADPAGEVTP